MGHTVGRFPNVVRQSAGSDLQQAGEYLAVLPQTISVPLIG